MSMSVLKKFNPFKKKGKDKDKSNNQKPKRGGSVQNFKVIMNKKEKDKKKLKKEKSEKGIKKEKKKYQDHLYEEWVQKHSNDQSRKMQIIDYQTIFSEDEQPLKNKSINPDAQTLKKHTELLLGEESKWCGEDNDEVEDFRFKMNSLQNNLYNKKIRKRTFELSRYFTVEPAFSSEEGSQLKCKIYLTQEELKLVGVKEILEFDTIEFTASGTMTGHDLCRVFLEEVNKRTMTIWNDEEIKKRIPQFIFKVKGTTEYIFGDNPLLDYEVIRNVLRMVKPELVLTAKNKLRETKSCYTKEERNYLKRLEEIEYDFEEFKREADFDYEYLDFIDPKILGVSSQSSQKKEKEKNIKVSEEQLKPVENNESGNENSTTKEITNDEKLSQEITPPVEQEPKEKLPEEMKPNSKMTSKERFQAKLARMMKNSGDSMNNPYRYSLPAKMHSIKLAKKENKHLNNMKIPYNHVQREFRGRISTGNIKLPNMNKELNKESFKGRISTGNIKLSNCIRGSLKEKKFNSFSKKGLLEAMKKGDVLKKENFMKKGNVRNKKTKKQVYSIRSLKKEVKVFIRNYKNFDTSKNIILSTHNTPSDCIFYVHVQICHGEYILAEVCSKRFILKPVVELNEELIPLNKNKKPFEMCDMPRETSLLITIYGRVFTKGEQSKEPAIRQETDFPVGSISTAMFCHAGRLKQGEINMYMNENIEASLYNFTQDNRSVQNICFLLPKFPLEVMFFDEGEYDESFHKKFKMFNTEMYYRFGKWNYEEEKKLIEDRSIKLPENKTKEEVEEIDRKVKVKLSDKKEQINKLLPEIKKIDPLMDVPEKVKWILWDGREEFIDIPELLPKFCLSVPFECPIAVREFHRLLEKWAKPTPENALELLDYKYTDQKIRELALKEINKMKNERLLLYLLQLVNALKFEQYHDSPLSRFLLQRALRNTKDVGHKFYWYLRSEMEESPHRERCGVILEEFIKRCGSFRIELLKMTAITEQLLDVAVQIKEIKGKDKKKQEKRINLCHELLRRIYIPYGRFRIPLFSRIELSRIVPEKGKVMSSKKLPLIIQFENFDTFEKENTIIMFKAGDDLRQDLLTLQMFRVMDNIWKENRLDAHMSIYECICTGFMTGMLEIVKDSTTIADILKEKGVFNKNAITLWLKEQIGKSCTNELDQRSNFLYSCAGYCVATFILGIGDRHNDNVMLKGNGNIFHIDFGHFLGHRKKFLGVKRETSPFVFTQQYADVLGGTEGDSFDFLQGTACQAFLLLREKSRLMMVLFLLMLGCGIAELRHKRDVNWMKDCLVLENNEDDAQEFFLGLIDESLGNFRQKLNDAWHVIWHKYL